MVPADDLSAYYNDNCFHYNDIALLSLNLSVKNHNCYLRYYLV